jgi:peroxiredoxin
MGSFRYVFDTYVYIKTSKTRFMKKIVFALIIVGVVLFLSYLGYGIYLRIREKSETILRVASLPSFNFTTSKGNKITEKNILRTPLWLIFFHSDCEYCQMEAENIQKAGKLNNIQTWMVSPEPLDTLTAFGARYHLNNLSYVHLLNDTQHAGYHTFGITSSPASFLYNSDMVLIRQYKGVVKIKTVLKDLEEARN